MSWPSYKGTTSLTPYIVSFHLESRFRFDDKQKDFHFWKKKNLPTSWILFIFHWNHGNYLTMEEIQLLRKWSIEWYVNGKKRILEVTIVWKFGQCFFLYETYFWAWTTINRQHHGTDFFSTKQKNESRKRAVFF